MVELGAGVAVVARNECDDGDVEAVESENFRVQDDVFRVFMVGARADVSADLVEDGGDLKEQRIVLGEVVEILEVGEEMGAEFPDMFAVAGIGLVTLGEDAGGAQHFGGE